MNKEQLPISKVFPNTGQVKGLPKNPRFIRDEKYKKLVQSIKDDPEMLDLRELIVYDTGDPALGYVVIGGNMRYRAMKELGYKDLPCKVLPTDFPLDKMRRIILKDNSSFGETDFEALINEWSLDEIDLAAIDIPDLGEALEDSHTESAPMQEAETHEDDDFEEDDVEDDDITEEGELWKLGRHLLLCGDSCKTEDVQRLFPNGEQCDLWLTDPPYNVGYGYEGSVRNIRTPRKDGLVVLNDKQDNEHFLMFLTDAFMEAKAVMKAGAYYYIFHSDTFGYYFRRALMDVGDMDLRQNLIWNKNSLVLGRQDYQWKHEPILTGWKGGGSHHWYGDHKQTTVIDWDRPTKSIEHPTKKPVGLCGYLMKNSSKKGDIVYDGFGGSGTTLIAAEQLGRECRMIELSPHYTKVIIWRYIQLKGNYADVFRINEDGSHTPISEIVGKDVLDALCGGNV